MAWSYTTGVLTSSGATEASPDSLLAGIAIVQAADATRGYRNGNLAWLNNVDVVISGASFIKADNDSTIEWRGASGIRGAGTNITGGFIGGASAKFILNVSTSRFLAFQDGATFITERRNPQDPSFSVYQNGTARVDFPTFGTIGTAFTLAKIDVNGLDLYANISATNRLTSRFYAGATISNIKDVRAFDRFGNDSTTFLMFGATYSNSYFENISFGSESSLINNVNLLAPTYYRASSGVFKGLIRDANFTVINATFLNNSWSGNCAFDSAGSQSKLSLLYSYLNTFKSGLTNLSGVNVRFTRARQSVNGSPTWTAPNSTITATSNGSGTYTAVNLLDAYREGTSLTNLERFNWTAKARKYDKKTAGETIFENRVLYRHSVNMSAGYSEEVQMLNVPYITLTEAQANALTGISIVASGATGGTVTITGTRTIAELWQYYRAWISQTANFDSNDTWTYDGVTLNIGAWTITGIEFLSGGTITTSTATAGGAISNLKVIGNVIQNTPTNLSNVQITGTLTYNTNTATSIAISNNTAIGTVANSGTGIVTISRDSTSSITTYTDAEINFLDSNLSAVGITSATIYQTEANRDSGTNPGATFTSSLDFKYGSVVNGVTMQNTIYLRVVVGSVTLFAQITLVTGSNVLDLGVQGQLSAINAKVTTTNDNLPKVNRNVINASKLIPAGETFN